ncbi:Uncharacterised protein [Chlamydia trachomatis]|nr:Uncharacterised protein [Chlamydia trachomatis]
MVSMTLSLVKSVLFSGLAKKIVYLAQAVLKSSVCLSVITARAPILRAVFTKKSASALSLS